MTPIEQFNAHRPMLFSIAYHILGSAMEAEDMVQDTFLRWQRANPAEVQSPKAYLSAIVTRLCIDHLRAACTQREEYIGPWLPEPLVSTTPPEADAAIQRETLSLAFLRLLEQLAPTERAVFLLREVFDYEYSEISGIVGQSPANCRQMVHRARQRLSAERPRFTPTAEQQERLFTQFVQACSSGDLPGLLTLLTDDITLWSDGGGKVQAARNPIHGADHVARFLLGVLRKAPPDTMYRPALVNGQPGFLTYINGVLHNVLALDIAEGQIREIYIVVNPDKLQFLQNSL